MLPSETMIWQPEFTDKTLSRKTGAIHCTLTNEQIILKLKGLSPVEYQNQALKAA
ncbi:PapI protein [Escherichia coli]|nr:PapI protein [Escherichia coli]EEU2052782.1 PapI protein [Escherichia coli]EEW4442040.1 PapI protein [Escherichia coli]EFA0374460.1 PapI protein [Escherichia coli]EFC3610324.1 PapI protein [Escherichia coli]